MTSPFTYEFGYSWPVVWGYLIPMVLFGGLLILAQGSAVAPFIYTLF